MGIPKTPQTERSNSFNPDAFFDSWANGEAQKLLYTNDFRKFVLKAFGLDFKDDYVYRATAEVTLLHAQTYLEFGSQGGLHAWYRDAENQQVGSVQTTLRDESHVKHSPKRLLRDLPLPLPT